MVMQASAGVGKTVAYTIAILSRINPASQFCQAIVLCATQQSVKQIKKIFIKLCAFSELECYAVLTQNLTQSTNTIQQSQIVIGVPDLIWNLIKQKRFSTHCVRWVVFDHTRLINIRQIMQSLPQGCQIISCQYILEATSPIFKQAITVSMKLPNLTLQGIRQFYVDVWKEEWKLQTLLDLVHELSCQCIVYADQTSIQSVIQALARANLTCIIITQNLKKVTEDAFKNQIICDLTLFRKGSVRILVIDSEFNCTHQMQIQFNECSNLIINYDMPLMKYQYMQRLGRSGKFGRKSVAINLVTQSQTQYLRQLQQYYCTSIVELPLDLTEI